MEAYSDNVLIRFLDLYCCNTHNTFFCANSASFSSISGRLDIYRLLLLSLFMKTRYLNQGIEAQNWKSTTGTPSDFYVKGYKKEGSGFKSGFVFVHFQQSGSLPNPFIPYICIQYAKFSSLNFTHIL